MTVKEPYPDSASKPELSREEKISIWKTAIGLQAVDGLRPSEYLLSLARRNIEGEISLQEAEALLNEYYKEK